MTERWAPELPPGRPLLLPGRGRLLVRELPGPPGAPVVVLLHGWTATSDLNWFPAYAELGRHFRVVAIDHRGHGRGIRSRRRFRLSDCADDVVEVADALGIERFIAVGYSMGGPVAALTWRRHRSRVSGLVLCATALRLHTGTADRLRLVALAPFAAALRVTPRRLLTPVFEKALLGRVHDRSLQPWIVEELRTGDPRALAEAGAALATFDARRWIDEIDVPVSVVVTTRDELVPPVEQERLAAAMRDVAVWRVDGDHVVCVGHPTRFVPALVESCRSVAERTMSTPVVDLRRPVPAPVIDLTAPERATGTRP